jgi:ataxia telangiectasia mutated family protein
VSYGCGPECTQDLLTLFARSERLRDDAYHGIFEALFRLVRSDKPEYLRTNSPRKRATLATRLSTSATVLRYAVEIGVLVISHKTTIAVIDHITDTLPVSGEGYCSPLRNDYLKSLRAILEHPSHVEHLRMTQWQSLSEFLVAGITHGSAEEASFKNVSAGREESEDSRNSRYLSVRTSQHSSSRSLGSQSTNSTAELLISLNLLTAATNAPLMTRASSILPCLTEFLEHATISQHDAFAAINNVLSRAIAEDIFLARSAVFGLMPIVRRLWSTKSSVVKDQMIITLTLGHELVANQDSTRQTESERLSLSNLFDVLVLDYQRRSDREMLHMDDIRFAEVGTSQPVGLQGIVPVIESGRALSNWSVVSIIASLAVANDSFPNAEETAELSNGTPRKRRKITKRVDDIVSRALASTSSEKAGALQIIIFLMEKSECIADIIAVHIVKLASGILDDDSTVASWSMLLFAQ